MSLISDAISACLVHQVESYSLVAIQGRAESEAANRRQVATDGEVRGEKVCPLLRAERATLPAGPRAHVRVEWLPHRWQKLDTHPKLLPARRAHRQGSGAAQKRFVAHFFLSISARSWNLS